MSDDSLLTKMKIVSWKKRTGCVRPCF